MDDVSDMRLQHQAEAGYLGPKAQAEALEKRKAMNMAAAGAEVTQLPKTGRFPPPTLVGRVTHTVYPIKHMVAVGGLATGFAFYGPFDTYERAATWARGNINLGARHGATYQVYPMFDVRDGR